MTEGRLQGIEGKLQTLDSIHDLILGLTVRLENLHAEFRQAGCQTRYFGQHQRPTFTKHEFPIFNPKDIPFWLWKCERYFNIAETPKENKVKMASIHFDEKTFLWHRAMDRRWRGCFPQWEEYIVLLQDRFKTSFESLI